LLYYEQRDLAHALIEFAEARIRSPNDSEVPFFISLVKRRQGKWDEAIELQRQALNLDPLNFEIRVNLARSYRSLRKFPEARDAADRALAVKAGNPDVLWMKAEICSAEGDLEQAEQLVNSVPNDHIPMVGGSLLFGRYIPLCISRQKFEQAIARISTELKGKNSLPPEMVAVENARIAQIKFYAGNLPVTRPLLEQARRELKAGKTVFPVRYTLIETDALLGLRDEVHQEAEAFLQMTQDDLYAGPIASEVAARGYAILGDAERAIPLLQHALSVPYFEAITPACLRFDPAWDRIRGNPRFQELLATPGQRTDAENGSLGQSIAVLPFENLSEDKSNDYLASGIQDELLVDLSKIGDLKVISRNSAQPYKDEPRDLREIGRALGVRTVLQGNVRTAGNRARLNVQLIDTTNDAQIWAESFDREVTDVLSMESELALRIAAALQTKLSPAEKAAIETLPTRDPEAYDLYLRARESVYSIRTRGDSGVDVHRAIDLLNQAVARDSNFALAYSFLAQMHLSDFESDGEPAQLEGARTNIETALRLAPDLGDAHLARGIYFNYGLRDYARASAEFAIARSALPNNAECLHWSGLLERRLGRWKEGLNYQLKAATLDPRDGMVQRDLLVTYCMLRNYADAERTIERAIIVSPQQTNFFRMKQAEVALKKGDLSACRTALESLPSDFEFNGFVAYLRARLALFERDYGQVAQILDEALNKLGRPKSEWWVLRDRAFLARAEGDRIKTQAAWENIRKFWESKLAAKPDDWQLLSWIAAADAALGRKEEAKREMEKSIQHSPVANDPVDGPTLAATEALVSTWCGNRERALAQLADLTKKPAGPESGDLKFDPRWDDLRGDPRFNTIAAAAAEPIKID
jgi:TolB-like protein/Tfp pilus assembly protein PilF